MLLTANMPGSLMKVAAGAKFTKLYIRAGVCALLDQGLHPLDQLPTHRPAYRAPAQTWGGRNAELTIGAGFAYFTNNGRALLLTSSLWGVVADPSWQCYAVLCFAGEPEPALQAHITKCLGLMRSGRSVMGELRKDPRFQNPKFLQKSVEFYSLQQYGTCLSPEVWDPSSLSEEDMWPALQQQLEARKRRRGAEVKFQPGGQQLPPLAAGMAAAAAAAAVASQPGMPGGGAPKVLSIDPRAAAAHAQALASTLVAGAGKKSKWDK